MNGKVVGYGIRQTVLLGDVQKKIFEVLIEEPMLTRHQIADKLESETKRIGNPIRKLLDAGIITIVLDRRGSTHKYRLTTFGKIVNKTEVMADGDFNEVVNQLNDWLNNKPKKRLPFPPPPLRKKKIDQPPEGYKFSHHGRKGDVVYKGPNGMIWMGKTKDIS